MPPLLLYNVLLVAAALVVAPLAALLCLVRPGWRRGLAARLGIGWPRTVGRDVLWAHAASVGEVEGIAPLVRRWREANPAGVVVLSALTATGCDAARRLAPDAVVRSFPLDLPWIARAVVRRVQPRLFLFSENELWPNAIAALARAGVPVVQVSGRVSDRAARTLARFPSFAAELLGRVTKFCVQGEEFRGRLIALGVAPERISVTGSLKADERIVSVPDFARVVASLGRPVIVAGSTHAGEEEALLDALAMLGDASECPRLLLAPRHPERFASVGDLLAERRARFLRRSRLSKDPEKMRDEIASADVLLLDTIGELAGCYAVATAAFVGGTLAPVGGHNLLEAARSAVPVVVGPNLTSVQRVAGRLEAAGGAAVVHDARELARELGRLLDPDVRARASEAARGVAASEVGGLDATWEAISAIAAAHGQPVTAGKAGRAPAESEARRA